MENQHGTETLRAERSLTHCVHDDLEFNYPFGVQEFWLSVNISRWFTDVLGMSHCFTSLLKIDQKYS